MADKFETPTDEFSGLPLPIYAPPIDQLDPCVRTNRHHHEHPSTDLKVGLGSEAVRHVRVQEVPRTLHNLYHAWFEGPVLPQTAQDKYRLVVFASAGLIPRQAIAFDEDDEPYLVDMTSDERLALWQSKTIHIEAPDIIRKFLLEYTLRHGRAAVNESRIDEFLNATDNARRLLLGRELLLAAAEATTEPLQEHYSFARKERLITPARSRQVGRFVCNLLTLGSNGVVRRKAINNLAAHLS